MAKKICDIALILGLVASLAFFVGFVYTVTPSAKDLVTSRVQTLAAECHAGSVKACEYRATGRK